MANTVVRFQATRIPGYLPDARFSLCPRQELNPDFVVRSHA